MPITPNNFLTYEQVLKYKARTLLINNHDDDFQIWLRSEAEIEFAELYVNCFKTYYYGTLSKAAIDRLALLGRTTIYLVRAFTVINTPSDIDLLQKYVEAYITAQIDNFDIDFDEEINWISDAEDYDPC